jgi:hypothetical protein
MIQSYKLQGHFRQYQHEPKLTSIQGVILLMTLAAVSPEIWLNVKLSVCYF